MWNNLLHAYLCYYWSAECRKLYFKIYEYLQHLILLESILNHTAIMMSPNSSFPVLCSWSRVEIGLFLCFVVITSHKSCPEWAMCWNPTVSSYFRFLMMLFGMCLCYSLEFLQKMTNVSPPFFTTNSWTFSCVKNSLETNLLI